MEYQNDNLEKLSQALCTGYVSLLVASVTHEVQQLCLYVDKQYSILTNILTVYGREINVTLTCLGTMNIATVLK